ncbi:MAG: ubiquinone/menaquinone biosynthesis methyltransferase [Chitinispirillaceae bacterium]
MSSQLRCTSQTLDNPHLKREYNQELFTEIAHAYSIVTGLLSWGRDRFWKRELITLLPQMENPRALDLACGTGDITKLLSCRYPQGYICGIDLTKAMLDPARISTSGTNMSFHLSDMCRLAFRDESFDIITGGYALRNAPELETALKEIHRVLKPNGTAAFLDFSRSPSIFISSIHLSLLTLWGYFWGLVLHRNPHTYGYIAKSLSHFPNRDKLMQLFEKQGFRTISTQRRFFGFAEITVVRKLDHHRSSAR